MKAHEVVAALAATNSKTEKESIVQDAFLADCTEFFHGAQLAYDKMVTFGVKRVPEHKGNGSSQVDESDIRDGFKVLATGLSNREATGSAAHEAIETLMEACTPELWNGWYRRVLLKDFKCGVSESTINKALTSLAKAGHKSAADLMVPVFTCQLAKDGEKLPKKMVGTKLLDVKLDGVRILAFLDKNHGTVTLRTRNGKINTNFGDIEKLLLKLLPHITESIVIDGEMVAKSFNELMTQVNRDSNVDTSDAKFAIFDTVPLRAFLEGEWGAPQKERDKYTAKLIETLNDERAYYIPKVEVNLSTPDGQAKFKEFNRVALEAGYEGVMVKDPDAGYETKRSFAWLKVKPTITVDLQIVELVAGDQGTKYEHCLGAIACAGTDEASGKYIEVHVGSGLTDQQREEFWADKDNLIGKTIEILADAISENQDGGHSLRFPRFVRFRDDK